MESCTEYSIIGQDLEGKIPEAGSVTLDQQKFKQVLYHLISHAVKFTSDDGNVEVAVRVLDPERPQPSKAAEDCRSPRRCRAKACPSRFMGPMRVKKGKRNFP